MNQAAFGSDFLDTQQMIEMIKDEDRLSKEIPGTAIEVHSHLDVWEIQTTYVVARRALPLHE